MNSIELTRRDPASCLHMHLSGGFLPSTPKSSLLLPSPPAFLCEVSNHLYSRYHIFVIPKFAQVPIIERPFIIIKARDFLYWTPFGLSVRPISPPHILYAVGLFIRVPATRSLVDLVFSFQVLCRICVSSLKNLTITQVGWRRKEGKKEGPLPGERQDPCVPHPLLL